MKTKKPNIMKTIYEKRLWLVIGKLYIVLSCNCLKGQDIHFSQFMMTPMWLDPSQAGKFRGDQRAVINYRDQWKSVMINPYRTMGASFDMPFLSDKRRKDNFFGGGIFVYADKAGEVNMKNTIFNAVISYHIRSGENSYLSAGIAGGFFQTSISAADMRFDSQFDGNKHNPALSSGEVITPSFLRPDIGVGISYSWGTDVTSQVISNNSYSGKKLNVGIAMHHVGSPRYSFLEGQRDRLSFRYVIHVNSAIGIGETNMAIMPSGFFQYQQGATNFLAGSYFRYTLKEQSKFTQYSKGAAFSIGAHYRMSDALIPSLLIEVGSVAIGLSYDVNTSGLSSVSKSRGGYEISIRYINPNPFAPRKTQARFF